MDQETHTHEQKDEWSDADEEMLVMASIDNKTITDQQDNAFVHKYDDKNDSDTSDDLIPLSELQIKCKRKHQSKPTDVEKDYPNNHPTAKQNYATHRKLNFNSDDNCDSDLDEDYIPTKCDVNSSDSDILSSLDGNSSNEDYICKNQHKLSNNRNKGWKRKPKHLKIIPSVKRPNKNIQLARDLKKKLIERQKQRRKSVIKQKQDILKAQKMSSHLQTFKSKLRKLHLERLDNLLLSNELTRQSVPSDGNCLFTAVCESLNEDETTQSTLRKRVCSHMSENKDNYITYLSCDQNEDLIERTAKYNAEVTKLSENGSWNAALADCLPLAIANVLQRPLKIFSSSAATPVYDIEPNLSDDTCLNCIHLAYIAIRHEEHYEVVSKLTGTLNNTSLDSSIDHITEGSFQDRSENEEEGVNITPYKRAEYKSPPKKHPRRKKQRNTATWKRNVRKHNRVKGKEYVSSTGKIIPEKHTKPYDCTKCRYKCSTKFSEQERQEICENYYQLGSYERQRDFICHMITCSSPKRKTKPVRKLSKQFYLVTKHKRERVCKNFFVKTLDIGIKTVDYALKRQSMGSFYGEDLRGTTPSGNKISSELLKEIRDHIESFPTMDSHYTRKDSRRKYLRNDLNIKEMWRLYRAKCMKNSRPFVKESKYREIFCKEYNLSFFKPKKDQCSLCNLYETQKRNGELKTEVEQKYKNHQRKKEEARKEKEKDKEQAKSDKSFHAACFDLQAVLTTPCSLISEMYYTRKLCCYNLTFYSLGDGQGVCHMWDECQGRRGSCEIASCLLRQTTSICQSVGIKEITYYSDACPGQNRNQFVAGALLYILKKNPSLNKLNHKFLESGHTQMECDSIHAAIETTKKKTSIYVPSQWRTIVSLARKNKPYIAVPLMFGDILDFKEYTKSAYTNLKLGNKGEKIRWMDIKWLQVRKEEPLCIFVNYTFEKEQFMSIDTQKTKTRKSITSMNKMQDPPQCYQNKLPISELKKKDLVSLCNKSIIPNEYKSFYMGLPSTKDAKDKLPQPGSDESEVDTDIE